MPKFKTLTFVIFLLLPMLYNAQILHVKTMEGSVTFKEKKQPYMRKDSMGITSKCNLDTVKAYLLVSDTTHFEKHYNISFVGNSQGIDAKMIKGYIVLEEAMSFKNEKLYESKTRTGTVSYQWNVVLYLDENKKRLPNNIIVWQAQY